MLDVRTLGDTFGAEVLGFQVTQTTTADDIDVIKGLWARHRLLLFRGQAIDEPTLVSFSQHFGELEIHVRTEYLSPDHPEILYVSNMQKEGRSVGILADTEVGWHYDQIYLPRPAVGSLLVAHTLPPTGGNTEFADMTAA